MLRQGAYTLAALVFLVVCTGALPSRVQAESVDISPHLAQQLHAVMDEKRSRTAAQHKIDTALLMAMQQQGGEPHLFATQGVDTFGDGTVVVEIRCPVTDDMVEAIEAMGGTVLTRHPRYDLIRARVPLSQLETLASKSTVRSVRSPVPMVTRQGAVITEGDRAHRADEVRSTYGLDGSGVMVCVISNGVDGLDARQAAGELPVDDVVILPGQEGSGSEGSAMLEVIHDLAPGAHLGFATALPNPEQFAANILDLAHILNCNIIVDDVGYLNQSPFQSGPISRAVEAVTASGVVFVSAAGNDGSKDLGTSGTYEGDYVDSGVNVEERFPSATTLFGSLHGFPTERGPMMTNQILGTGSGIALHWTDPLGQSAHDYDLCLVNEGLSALLACSTFTQDGDDDPFELIPFAPLGSRAMIINFDDTAAPRFFHLQAFGGVLEIGTSGAIFGHPGTDAVIAVGAADVKGSGDNDVFGPEDMVRVEHFSADGPRRVFFDADGNLLTPSDLSSTGGVLRQKPDVIAADQVITTTPGFSPFSGTSAAAPHVAGVVALMLQADPTLTPDQVKSILGNTAMDIEQIGPDHLSGFGVIDARAALDAPNRHEVVRINHRLSPGKLRLAFDGHDPRAPAGVLTIRVTLTNISQDQFTKVYFQVDTLTGGHQVLNADGGPGGVGAQVRGPDTLDAGEAFDVVFEIGLQRLRLFRFFVGVFGTPGMERNTPWSTAIEPQPKPSFMLHVEGDLLSLQATHASLKGIVHEMGRQMDILVLTNMPDEVVTTSFQGLNVVEACKHLHVNAIYFQRAEGERARITKIIALQRGPTTRQRLGVDIQRRVPGLEPFQFNIDPIQVQRQANE